jgi:restriction endonuclease Mrr
MKNQQILTLTQIKEMCERHIAEGSALDLKGDAFKKRRQEAEQIATSVAHHKAAQIREIADLYSDAKRRGNAAVMEKLDAQAAKLLAADVQIAAELMLAEISKADKYAYAAAYKAAYGEEWDGK